MRTPASIGCLLLSTRATSRLLLVAGALLLGCNDRGDGSGGGGTVVVGMRSDFGGFNPVTTSGQYDFELIDYALFTPLVQYDKSLEVRPYLAESWELQGDTGVVFHLRNDVRWHDGQPVTAHALQNVGAGELRNAPFNRQPVGSGPYRLQEWRANERLLFVRNPDFPQALGGPAAAERVVFRIIPEASTMLTELLTGSIHVDIPLLPNQAQQVQSGTDTQLHSVPGKTVYFVGWNNARPMFADARVRRALGLAINRQEIVKALLQGHGEVAAGPIPPWHRLNPGVAPQPHDVQQAIQLLEQAGWQDRNGDGVRENA